MKVKAIEALRKKTYEEGIMFMIKRNREKISEIWFIIDKNRDEIDFMKQQVLHGDVSSVRAWFPGMLLQHPEPKMLPLHPLLA